MVTNAEASLTTAINIKTRTIIQMCIFKHTHTHTQNYRSTVYINFESVCK